jgi:Secretion system C-terminal sorting domain
MKKTAFSMLLPITLLSIILPRSYAQWVETNGPYEASVCSFAASDSFIFAGTIGAGIYRSVDNGVTWTPSNGGMTSVYTLCLAASGRNIYAGSATAQGISLSTDNGRTWQAVNNGLPPNPWAFEPDQVTGVIDRLVASGSNVFTSMRLSPEAFYLSTNNGSNWIDANTGAIPGISSIALIGNNFFIGGGNGVYISTNSGTTWTSAGLADSAITCIVVSGAKLFAGTSSGVLLSTNNGTTWTSSNSGLQNKGIVQLSASGNYILAKTSVGYFLSTDSGTSWAGLGSTGFPVSYAAPNTFTPIGTNLFYGFLDWGIYRSTNNGNSWSLVNTGLEESSITALAATRKTAFVSTFDYLYALSPGSSDWIPALVGQRVPTVKDTVIYVTADSGASYSTDEGKSWEIPLNNGAPTGFQYTALAVAGTNIFLGGAGICGLCDQGGVYLSTNNGDNWSKKGLQNIAALFARGTTTYAVMLNGLLFVSTNAGSSWNILSAPPVNALAFRDSETFVGSTEGVFRSFSEGKQWEQISTGLAGSALLVNSLVVCGTNVFAGTNLGVYVLNNDGTSWTGVSTGLPSTSGPVYHLAATDSDIYASFSGAVWKRPISDMITAAKSPLTNTPVTFSLFQNYPNPFNPTTVISYQLPAKSIVTLKVYDMLGRLVMTLIDETQNVGIHSLTLNATSLSSGVYFYRLTAGTSVETKKLILIK